MFGNFNDENSVLTYINGAKDGRIEEPNRDSVEETS